jgi:hypothetical protein
MRKFVLAGLMVAGLTAGAFAQGTAPVHVRGVWYRSTATS